MGHTYTKTIFCCVSEIQVRLGVPYFIKSGSPAWMETQVCQPLAPGEDTQQGQALEWDPPGGVHLGFMYFSFFKGKACREVSDSCWKRSDEGAWQEVCFLPHGDREGKGPG